MDFAHYAWFVVFYTRTFIFISADKGFSNLKNKNVEISHMLPNINPRLLIDIHNNATIGTFYIAHSNEIMERKQKAMTSAMESQRIGCVSGGQDVQAIPCK